MVRKVRFRKEEESVRCERVCLFIGLLRREGKSWLHSINRIRRSFRSKRSKMIRRNMLKKVS